MSGRSMALAGGLAALVLVVVLGIVLVTGSEESSSSSGATTTEAPVAGEPSAELQDCLAEQGVDIDAGFPGGVPSAGEQPGPEQLQAIQECSEYLPEGGPPGAPPDGLEFPAQ